MAWAANHSRISPNICDWKNICDLLCVCQSLTAADGVRWNWERIKGRILDKSGVSCPESYWTISNRWLMWQDLKLRDTFFPRSQPLKMTRRVLTDCEWHKISRAGELTDCEECGSKHRWATRGLETDTCPNIDHAPNSVLRAAACLLVGMVEGSRALRTSAWDEGSKFLTWWPDPSFWVVSRSKRESGSLVARTLWNELVLWDSHSSLQPSLGWHQNYIFYLILLRVGLLEKQTFKKPFW